MGKILFFRVYSHNLETIFDNIHRLTGRSRIQSVFILVLKAKTFKFEKISVCFNVVTAIAIIHFHSTTKLSKFKLETTHLFKLQFSQNNQER